MIAGRSFPVSGHDNNHPRRSRINSANPRRCRPPLLCFVIFLVESPNGDRCHALSLKIFVAGGGKLAKRIPLLAGLLAADRHLLGDGRVAGLWRAVALVEHLAMAGMAGTMLAL